LWNNKISKLSKDLNTKFWSDRDVTQYSYNLLKRREYEERREREYNETLKKLHSLTIPQVFGAGAAAEQVYKKAGISKKHS